LPRDTGTQRVALSTPTLNTERLRVPGPEPRLQVVRRIEVRVRPHQTAGLGRATNISRPASGTGSPVEIEARVLQLDQIAKKGPLRSHAGTG
jgi:hypothetical protein